MKALHGSALTALLCVAGVASFAPLALALDAPKAADPPPKMAGLCVRTAPKGYVVLEARLMTSSGDPQLDARAVKEISGSEVPRPNSRMWFEWLAAGWSATTADGVSSPGSALTFDCSALDAEARRKAKAR